MREYAKIVRSLRICADGNCPECDYWGEAGNGCYFNLKEDAADAIEELLAKVPHWISVEERLPELYAPVLVAYIGYNTGSILSDMTAYRDGDGDWCWYDGDFPSGDMCKVEVTHWMPLPAPPKGVE